MKTRSEESWRRRRAAGGLGRGREGARRETKVGWEKEERQWRGVGERGVYGGQGGGLREG